MDLNKRYCQNRVSKRKKQPGKGNWCFGTEDASPTSVEEERQFKLNRFVKDVNKFVEERRQCSNTTYTQRSSKDTVAALQKPVRTVVHSKPTAKMGLFRNGVQTKFYTRGLMGKDLTARLDEDLHQIIALATNNKENECHCLHQKSKPVAVFQPTASTSSSVDREPLHTLTSRTPKLAEKWPEEEVQTTPGSENMVTRMAQLDLELYPEFARSITNSAVQTKNALFSGINYFAEKKKDLLNIYLKAQREQSQDGAGLSETQKSSVATSPMRSPSPQYLPSPPVHNTSRQDDIKETFQINFVPEPIKSFKQILEETADSRSSCLNIFSPPLEPRVRLPPTPSPLRRRRRGRRRSRSPPSQASSYDEPSIPSPVPQYYLSSPPDRHTLTNFEPMRYQRSRPHFSSLLPPVEEESPELKYYPMFVF